MAVPARVPLAPADYWRLRAKIRDVEAEELELLKAQIEIGRRLQAARAGVAAVLKALEQQYPDIPPCFGWNDDTLELIAQAPPAPQENAT